MNWHDPKHPVWPIIRIFAVAVSACLVLMVTASSFDSTELKAIAGIAGGATVAEALKRKFIG